MPLLHTLLLSALEGITEFLPISSTGHLMLASNLLRISPSEFLKTFEISIQLGAILAAVVLYARTLIVNARVLLLAIAGFVPTGIIGFLLHGLVKSFLLESIATVLWSLLLGGIVLIGFEYFHRERPNATMQLERITLSQALLIGCFQSIAIIPGVSRAAATIVGGLLLGLNRKTIVEFSFLLAIPTMAAATGYDLLKTAPSFTSSEIMTLAIGILVAFVTALAAIKWLLQYIQTHTFTAFGIYRILVALTAFLFMR